MKIFNTEIEFYDHNNLFWQKVDKKKIVYGPITFFSNLFSPRANYNIQSHYQRGLKKGSYSQVPNKRVGPKKRVGWLLFLSKFHK